MKTGVFSLRNFEMCFIIACCWLIFLFETGYKECTGKGSGRIGGGSGRILHSAFHSANEYDKIRDGKAFKPA